MTAVRLTDPVSRVHGIGAKRAATLAGAEIRTVEELLLHLPFRYEDRSSVVPIDQLRDGERCTVRGEVQSCKVRRRGRNSPVQARIADESGSIEVVWFNQPYMARTLRRGQRLWLHGKVTSYRERLQLVNPVVEDSSDQPLHVGRLVPVYRRIGDLGPALLRRLIDRAVEDLGSVEDHLPPETRRRLGLIERGRALRRVHRPPAEASADDWSAATSEAHRRLAAEELIAFHAALRLRKPPRSVGGISFDVSGRAELVERALPFELTAGQRRALDDILGDMEAAAPMHRLLQGDVGCGKTAVAAVAMLLTAGQGWQAALLVPTAILAEQQAAGLAASAAPLRLEVGCLTAGRPPAERQRTRDRLRDGTLKLVVGTHALLQPEVEFARLGLAVVDEQHRFGVRQRAALSAKGAGPERWPDLLVMTATPIPRSLALTLYGDLDLCNIDDLPPGRRPVRTRVLPVGRWDEVVEALRRAAARGEQAFVVAPRIDEGEDEVRAAVTLEEELGRGLPGVDVGLLHGAMSAEEKDAAMRSFVSGDTQVLATTTVVEVGVDVSSATLMVVDHAERFGLAQLHQLRGRVGRGSAASRCLLVVHPPLTPAARRRLQVVASTTDGFVIAERDLELRGPGELAGTLQAGISELRVADPFRDRGLLEAARDEAHRLMVSEEPGAAAFRRGVRDTWLPQLAPAQAG